MPYGYGSANRGGSGPAGGASSGGNYGGNQGGGGGPPSQGGGGGGGGYSDAERHQAQQRVAAAAAQAAAQRAEADRQQRVAQQAAAQKAAVQKAKTAAETQTRMSGRTSTQKPVKDITLDQYKDIASKYKQPVTYEDSPVFQAGFEKWNPSGLGSILAKGAQKAKSSLGLGTAATAAPFGAGMYVPPIENAIAEYSKYISDPKIAKELGEADWASQFGHETSHLGWEYENLGKQLKSISPHLKTSASNPSYAGEEQWNYMHDLMYGPRYDEDVQGRPGEDYLETKGLINPGDLSYTPKAYDVIAQSGLITPHKQAIGFGINPFEDTGNLPGGTYQSPATPSYQNIFQTGAVSQTPGRASAAPVTTGEGMIAGPIQGIINQMKAAPAGIDEGLGSISGPQNIFDTGAISQTPGRAPVINPFEETGARTAIPKPPLRTRIQDERAEDIRKRALGNIALQTDKSLTDVFDAPKQGIMSSLVDKGKGIAGNMAKQFALSKLGLGFLNPFLGIASLFGFDPIGSLMAKMPKGTGTKTAWAGPSEEDLRGGNQGQAPANIIQAGMEQFQPTDQQTAQMDEMRRKMMILQGYADKGSLNERGMSTLAQMNQLISQYQADPRSIYG